MGRYIGHITIYLHKEEEIAPKVTSTEWATFDLIVEEQESESITETILEEALALAMQKRQEELDMAIEYANIRNVGPVEIFKLRLR